MREVKPEYTPEAMERKIQGSVWLKASSLETGDVGDIEVTRSLDAEYGLDREAIDAAKQWKFKPGTKDGKPVAVRVTHRADLHAEISRFSAILGGGIGPSPAGANSPEVAVMAHNGQHLRGLLVRSCTALILLASPAFAGGQDSVVTVSSNPASSFRRIPTSCSAGRARSIGVRGNWLMASAGSDIFDFVTEHLSIEKSDFNTASFALDTGVHR